MARSLATTAFPTRSFGSIAASSKTHFFGIRLQCQVEIPLKFALRKYILECAPDVGCCIILPEMIGDSLKKDKDMFFPSSVS